MANLTVKLRGQVVASLRLEPGRSYIAGRATEADIVLNPERGISRQHLKFYERDGRWVCESLSKFVRIEMGGESGELVELHSSTIFVMSSYEFYFEPSGAPLSTTSADSTRSASLFVVPYLRAQTPNSSEEQIHRLEGHIWTVGREADCEITIESPHVSRRHFDITRAEDGFFVTDLGSSNGTTLNGQRLPAYIATPLRPGDDIEIRGIKLTLEFRDGQFTQKVAEIPIAPLLPLGQGEPVLVKLPGKTINAVPRRNLTSHAVKIGTALAILAGGLAAWRGSQPPIPSPAAGGLTAEQQLQVRTTFDLARNLYIRGAFHNCAAELAKLHQIVPQYENSKELAAYCDTAIELVEKQRVAEHQAQQAKEAEDFVVQEVEKCKASLNPNASVADTKTCLQEAEIRIPGHHAIAEAVQAAEVREKLEQALSEQKKAEFRQKEIDKRRRELASVKKVKQEKAADLAKECRALGKAKEYRRAHILCAEALKLDPDNSAARSVAEKVLKDLHRILKSRYEDSVLEESMGNVASAKEKWQKIIDDDVPNGKYGAMAQEKLQKYGDDL